MSLTKITALVVALAASFGITAPVTLEARTTFPSTFRIKAGSSFLSVAPGGGAPTIATTGSNFYINSTSFAGVPGNNALASAGAGNTYLAWIEGDINAVFFHPTYAEQTDINEGNRLIVASLESDGTIDLEPFETHASFYPFICSNNLYLSTVSPFSTCTQTKLTIA